MAPGISLIFGQAASISLNVNTNLLLLRASNDNLESCWTALLQGSGKLVKSVIFYQDHDHVWRDVYKW